MDKSLALTALAILAIPIPPSFAQNNINYAGTGQVAHTLNIYKPSGTGPFPVVINYGGQAFSWGDTKSDGGLKSSFNAAGIAVVGANLSGGGTGANHARYPAQIQELKATVRFLRANAKEYNLDPDFIGVTGFSSGAWNTVMLATTGDVDEHKIGNTTMKLEGTFGLHHDVSSRVQAGWASAAPTDFSKMDGCGSSINHGSATSPEGNLIGGALSTLPDNVQLANPITYVSKDDPPLYLRHGSSDNVVPTCQSALLWDAIKAVDNKKDMNYTAVAGGHAPNTTGILAFFQKAIQNNKEGCLDPKHAKFDPMATYCGTGDCCAATSVLTDESGKPLFTLIPGNFPGGNLSAGTILVSTTGPHRFRVSDVSGIEILSASGRGQAEYAMGTLNPGVYFVTVATATTVQTRKVFRF
jgi:acetyl esterase/lipase